jgi:hypothetical protein
MILFLDENGCTTTRDKAVLTLFGVPDWVAEDIREYGTRYCCSFQRFAKGIKLGTYRCEGMRGARNFTVETYPCIDANGRDFALNIDDINNIRLPLVCMRRYVGGSVHYKTLIRNYQHMFNIAKRAVCEGYCVLDEAGKIVVFGSDLFSVVDSWAMLMRRRDITMLSVLVQGF